MAIMRALSAPQLSLLLSSSCSSSCLCYSAHLHTWVIHSPCQRLVSILLVGGQSPPFACLFGPARIPPGREPQCRNHFPRPAASQHIIFQPWAFKVPTLRKSPWSTACNHLHKFPWTMSSSGRQAGHSSSFHCWEEGSRITRGNLILFVVTDY
jgi:hypothetical protein